MKFLLGTKQEMTQVYDEAGLIHPVTKITAGPCVVTQVKTAEVDGYSSVQVGYGEQKEHRIGKSKKNHLKDLPLSRHLREFRTEEGASFERGQEIKVDTFEVDEKVDVAGTSKGKGFQGVVKRHGFHGKPRNSRS